MKQSLVEILHRIISKSQGARLRAKTGIEEHSCRKKKCKQELCPLEGGQSNFNPSSKDMATDSP